MTAAIVPVAVYGTGQEFRLPQLKRAEDKLMICSQIIKREHHHGASRRRQSPNCSRRSGGSGISAPRTLEDSRQAFSFMRRAAGYLKPYFSFFTSKSASDSKLSAFTSV